MKRLKDYYNRQIEKMGKKQKVTFYTASVVLALLVLLNIGGLAYAFFTATVIGNDTAKGDVVETGSLSIVYTNGQELRGEDILPGWSETKTFTVENTGTVEATYNINWENLTNTFVNKGDLVYTLTSTNSGGTLTETQMPDSGEHVSILSNIKIAPEVTQTYTLTVTYRNRDADQSSDMGKSLIGKIEVVDVNGNNTKTGAETLIAKATEDNTDGLIKLEQPKTTQTEALTEYRYSGSNNSVKNYVTFNDEEWRIIGVSPVDDGTGKVENRIKLIKSSELGKYVWDASSSSVNYGGGINQWGASGSYAGADLMQTLNGIYYNSTSGNCYIYDNNNYTAISSTCNFTNTGLSEEARNMIGNAKWYTAASEFEVTTAQAYSSERGSTVGTANTGQTVTKTTSWTGKVGLMYASDYGYASSSCYSTTNLFDYEEACYNSDWLYDGNKSATITPLVGFNNMNLTILPGGFINSTLASAEHSVRPSVYLTSNVKITNGDGSKSNPYQLSL